MAGTASQARSAFETRVKALVGLVKAWAEPHDWITKEYPKKLRDAEHQVYELPALFLQKGPVRVLLDPIAYDVPGSEGVVDLYLMPTYDDMANLEFRNGGWEIRYAFPADAAANVPTMQSPAPLTSDSINQVLDAIAAHAEPSI